MTTLDEARLRSLAEKATKGPWQKIYYADDPYGDIDVMDDCGWRRICRIGQDDAPDHDYNAQQKLNVDFIAACDPQTIIALLDELDKLRKVAEMTEALMIRHDFWSALKTLPGEYDDVNDALNKLEET